MKRYRKVMGLAIVLVALAVAINALAFKTASVTNQAHLTISASKSAALSIDAAASPGTGFQILGHDTNSMELTIQDQMQPNSTYLFSNVFRIIDNAQSGTVTLAAPVINGLAGATVTLYKAGTATLAGGTVSGGTTIGGTTLNKNTGGATPQVGSYVDVDVVVAIPSGGNFATADTKNFTIIIDGSQP